MTTTYETIGETPARTLTQRVDGELVLMMTEIDAGVFVGWDHCDACRAVVAECRCAGGPIERDFIARWRQERLDKANAQRSPIPAPAAEVDEPEAEPELEDSDTRQEPEPGAEAASRAARAAAIPVEF